MNNKRKVGSSSSGTIDSDIGGEDYYHVGNSRQGSSRNIKRRRPNSGRSNTRRGGSRSRRRDAQNSMVTKKLIEDESMGFKEEISRSDAIDLAAKAAHAYDDVSVHASRYMEGVPMWGSLSAEGYERMKKTIDTACDLSERRKIDYELPEDVKIKIGEEELETNSETHGSHAESDTWSLPLISDRIASMHMNLCNKRGNNKNDMLMWKDRLFLLNYVQSRCMTKSHWFATMDPLLSVMYRNLKSIKELTANSIRDVIDKNIPNMRFISVVNTTLCDDHKAGNKKKYQSIHFGMNSTKRYFFVILCISSPNNNKSTTKKDAIKIGGAFYYACPCDINTTKTPTETLTDRGNDG